VVILKRKKAFIKCANLKNNDDDPDDKNMKSRAKATVSKAKKILTIFRCPKHLVAA